jgi:hypothetical protein
MWSGRRPGPHPGIVTGQKFSAEKRVKAIMKNLKDTSGLGFVAAASRACLSMVPHGVALVCALSAVGCLAPSGDESDADGEVGVAQEAALTHNALTHNALTHNALTHNALSSSALVGSSLTSTSLTSNSSLSAALTDADSREVLGYVVGCALPAGSALNVTVSGVAYSFPGELGIAPTWGQAGGTCTTSCQEAVSACVLARLDYLGDYVALSLRGSSAALDASSSEMASYPTAEGAYYGNIFLATPKMLACIAPGQTGLSRVCGPTTVGCIVNVIGDCDDVCDHADKREGFFPNCRDAAKDAGGHFPAGTRTYASAATVFLAP